MERTELHQKHDQIIKNIGGVVCSLVLMVMVFVVFYKFPLPGLLPSWYKYAVWPVGAILVNGLILGLRNLIYPKPFLILTPEGIKYPSVRRFVAWDNVAAVYLQDQHLNFGGRAKSITWLCIEARDPGIVRGRESKWVLPWKVFAKAYYRYAGFKPNIVLWIPSQQLPIPVDETLHLIEEYRKATNA